MNQRPDQLRPLIENATSDVRTQPVRPGAAEYMDAEGRFVSACPKCRGSGRFYSYRGRDVGPCHACKGKRTVSHAQPADQRARNRASAAIVRQRREEDNVAEFTAAHAEEMAWLQRNATWAPAADIMNKVRKYGTDLHEATFAFIRRGIDRDVAKVVARQEAIARAPTADEAGVERLKAAFDRAARIAAEKGRKFAPRLTVGAITISPARATSANAGALYVKHDGVYMGKVVNNKFFATQACDESTKGTVLRFIADPKGEAERYGKEYKFCCICNRTLTNEESMTRGMGPVCAEYFGW